MIWPLGLLAAVAAAPFLREALRRPMNAKARRDAPGQFVRLSQGITHYLWRGPQDGPVAVCVHGLTTPSFIWDSLGDGLVRMGYRVLVYDLYGRGFSDRAKGPQDSAFFTTQLTDLLDSQGVRNDITLLGYSMGGAIVPDFAALHPARLRELVLLAPAGLGHDLGPALRRIAATGPLGTWAMLWPFAFPMRRAIIAENDCPISIPRMTERQLAQLQTRGFLPAVLSSLRNLMRAPLDDAHRAIAAAKLPVLAIWAGCDEVIPLLGRDRLAALNPDARNVVIDGAVHSLGYTDADRVMAVLQSGLRPGPAGSP